MHVWSLSWETDWVVNAGGVTLCRCDDGCWRATVRIGTVGEAERRCGQGCGKPLRLPKKLSRLRSFPRRAWGWRQQEGLAWGPKLHSAEEAGDRGGDSACAGGAHQRSSRWSDGGYTGASGHGGDHGSRAGGGEAGPTGTCATADRRAGASVSISGRDCRGGQIGATWTSATADRERIVDLSQYPEEIFGVEMLAPHERMRHVSRTHRVALDWLFDRINLDPRIQIKYIDTKNQLADIHNKIDAMKDIDSVPSNVQSAHHEALLYVFEDNEAVIKMIINGRSPTMRHVSRTHRVALDWLFDRIYFGYIDSKNQLADILTKGNFTRDEWNPLLCLFSISHFSSIKCLEVMSKRTHEAAGEERVTAKSKPMMNLVLTCCLYCIRKPREKEIWKSNTSELVEWAANKYGETCNGRWLIRPLRMEYWRKVVFSRVEIWWNVGSKNGETRGWQSAGSFTQHTDKFVIDDDDVDSNTATESDFSLK